MILTSHKGMRLFLINWCKFLGRIYLVLLMWSNKYEYKLEPLHVLLFIWKIRLLLITSCYYCFSNLSQMFYLLIVLYYLWFTLSLYLVLLGRRVCRKFKTQCFCLRNIRGEESIHVKLDENTR